MPESVIADAAVKAAAEVYASHHGAGNWQDHAGPAREIIAAFLAHVEGEAADLQHRVQDLRAFEREYRSRLDAYLEGQLKDLRGHQ